MKRHIRHVQLALAVLFTTAVSVFAYQAQQADPPRPEFSGKVVSVADGDTITVLHNNTQHRIRLEGIDCPESHQAFGTKATKAIADKVFGKEVTIKWKARDKYKRILGEVFLGDRHINLEMVQEGWAWHYVQYSKDPALAKAEKDARAGKKGLWVDPNPIAPWDFRHGLASKEEVQAGGKNLELAKITVYVTKTGQKYHREGCRYLAKSKIPTSLGDAMKRYGPCSVCKPPTMEASVPAKEKEDEVQKGEPGETTYKVDASLLEKSVGVKVKSVSHVNDKLKNGMNILRIKILMEFTKDLDAKELAELKQFLNLNPRKIRFVPQDQDGVALAVPPPGEVNWHIEGEMSGMKGDAFRIVVPLMNMNEVRRVVIRQAPPKEK